ncbi:hypothetical protein M6B38_132640 [Iris pallida]|uniref:Uncharacterized protein n=1 Tax=Iris pallida TaxID=29817 RepID=A0AAX6FHG2_IRIPA|nr:hypothetical protein M6B38_132640 [Iris pallida]
MAAQSATVADLLLRRRTILQRCTVVPTAVRPRQWYFSSAIDEHEGSFNRRRRSGFRSLADCFFVLVDGRYRG